jgi:RING finger/CHY zinc finger protein 1
MDFTKVARVRCLACEQVQDKRDSCLGCGLRFGLYYCGKCALYDNTKNKDITHCDKCGMCRRGREDTLRHCDKCGICINEAVFADHGCFEMEGYQCAVCLEGLKYSTKFSFSLQHCRHWLHNECYQEYVEAGNSDCPVCGRALFRMSQAAKTHYDHLR